MTGMEHNEEEQLSDYERAVLSRPELVAALDRGIAQLEAGQGVIRTRGDRPAHADG